MLCLAFGAGLAAWAWPYLVDDAFIAAGYARHLAGELHYGFQAGPATDGVTGPLWLLPLALFARSGLDAVVGAKLFGALATGLAVALVHRFSARRAGGQARSVFLALWLGSAAPVWIWAIGGLETGLATLLVTLLITGALRRPAPAAGRVGAAAALLSWLRPELLPLSAYALLLVQYRSRNRRAGAWALSLALLGLGGVLLFRQLFFGHWLPLSAHAKPPLFVHGARYVLECATTPAALSLWPFIAAAVRWGGRVARALCVSLTILALSLLLAGGDWMAGARLFVPGVPLAAYVAAQGAWRMWQRRRAWAVALVALAGLVRVPAAALEANAARRSGLLREARLPALLAALQQDQGPVALLDIGAVGYRGGRQVIDLGGLIEPRVAYARGGHLAKHIDAAWLAQKAPGVIVLHSRVRPRVDAAGHVRFFAGYPVERRVLAMPWVWQRYRVRSVIEYDVDYFYLVLAKAPQG